MGTRATEEVEGEILAAFPKNGRGEEVRLRAFEFKGLRLVDVRQWYPAAGGEMKPGKGLALRVDQLPDLAAAVAQACAALELEVESITPAGRP
jgi:hypothetical protein